VRRQALVVGAGLAGLTCAHLLAGHGWDIELWDLGARRAPPLLLNDGTVWLLRDLWRGADDLAGGAVRLRARTVRWGNSPEVTVEHAGMVVDGESLRQRLLARLPSAHPGRVRLAEVGPAGLTGRLAGVDPGVQVVDASGRRAHAATVLGQSERRVLGRRCVLAAQASLAEPCAPEGCWMETVRGGWIFLAPAEVGQGVLQAMVPAWPEDPESTLRRMLAEARLIRGRVGALAGPVTVLPAAPECSDPLLGAGWIAVGDAAIALDPVSGDGTGHGLRGAVLAASTLDAVASGRLDRSCLGHYHARLVEALRVHLQRCLAYYSAASFSPTWQGERAAIAQALQAMAGSPGAPVQLRYALRGSQLVPLRASPRGSIR